jgi:hypothetical protein
MNKEPNLFVGVDWASKEHQFCTPGNTRATCVRPD